METHAKAVVVQAGEGVIPEKGHLGHAPGPGVIYVTVDPDNPALHANVNRSLERMFAHELHHAARWEGPGYGSSLGEALVSEGLAGHFARELFGGPPEPWELLPVDEVRSRVARAGQKWNNTDYRHEVWFFGTRDLPEWFGYSPGFHLVERFLSEHPGSRASNLAAAGAEGFQPMLQLLS